MKKTIGLMFGAMLSLNVMAAEWYDEATGFTWKYSIAGSEAILNGCSPNEGELPPLPQNFEGFPVTKIADYAFHYCPKLTGALRIPESVHILGTVLFLIVKG